MKEIIKPAVQVALGLALVPVIGQMGEERVAFAAKTCQTQAECDEAIEQAQDKIDKIEQQTQQKEENLEKVEQDLEGLMQQVEETQRKIKDTESKITKTETEIKASEAELERLDGLIKELKKVVGVRMQVAQRLNHSNMILNWLSESQSLAGFIQTVQNIKHFAENDAEEMDELKKLVKAQNETKARLETQKKSLLDAKSQLESSRKTLEVAQKALEAKRAEVKKEIQALEKDRLSAQEVQKIAQEQKELLEKLAQEEANKNESSSNQSQVVIPSSSGFRIPLAHGYVSCEFMCYPGHNGIDLGNRSNAYNTAVLASASGIVTRSGWHSAYGNHVMITHNINGKVYTTVYAHMKTAPYVSVGQTVYQGQQLGLMGTTGNSTGPHLHFELYEGYYRYPYSVNPRKYINFPSRW